MLPTNVHPNMIGYLAGAQLVAAKEMRNDLSQLRPCGTFGDKLAWNAVAVDMGRIGALVDVSVASVGVG